MAVNDHEQSNSLLTYYRTKIQEFDKERIEWLTRIEEIRIQYQDKHQLEWELVKRKEEIAELQRSISESKFMLYEERQLSLRLQRENDMLKVKEMEDRRKIQELLTLSGPYEEQVVLQKDVRPETTQKYNVQNELSLSYVAGKENKSIKRGTLQGPAVKTFGTGSRSVVKTIYLPNEQLNAVAVENENLKRQLDEAHQLLNQQFHSLNEEMKNIQDDYRLRMNNDQQKVQQLLEKQQRLEKHNIELNKDFYQSRQRNADKERQAQEESNIIRQRNTDLLNQVQQLEKKYNVESKAEIEKIEKQSEEYTKKYKNQARQKEENLIILKEQYAQIQQIYIQKIRQLEENLSKLVEKYQALERRRVLEIEGFRTDIKRLNQRLKGYDKKILSQNFEKMDQDDLQKYHLEAQRLKEEAVQQAQRTYGGDPQNTKKKGKKSTKQPKQLQKTQKQVILSPESRDLNEIQEEDDNNEFESSLPLNELEELQRQLEDLERKMDAAKKE